MKLRHWRDILSTLIEGFLSPFQVLPILLWFVLHAIEKSKIPLVSNLFELSGHRICSTWRLDPPSDTFELSIGDI